MSIKGGWKKRKVITIKKKKIYIYIYMLSIKEDERKESGY